MVQWTADKDQLLLKGVFQFCDIKCSGPLLKHLSEIIGEDCTPKAVQHRLNNIKNTGKMTKGSETPTPKKPVASKTPGSSARGRGRPAKGKNFNDEPLPSPIIGRKRGCKPKKTPSDVAEEDNDEERAEKKIKMEYDDFINNDDLTNDFV